MEGTDRHQRVEQPQRLCARKANFLLGLAQRSLQQIAVFRIAATARDYYANLIGSGSNEAFRSRMFDFTGLNAVIGTPGLLAEGRAYDEEVV